MTLRWLLLAGVGLMVGCASSQPRVVVEILDPRIADTSHRIGDIEAQTQITKYHQQVSDLMFATMPCYGEAKRWWAANEGRLLFAAIMNGTMCFRVEEPDPAHCERHFGDEWDSIIAQYRGKPFPKEAQALVDEILGDDLSGCWHLGDSLSETLRQCQMNQIDVKVIR